MRKFYLANDPANNQETMRKRKRAGKTRQKRQGSLGDQGGVMSPEKPVAPLARKVELEEKCTKVGSLSPLKIALLGTSKLSYM